MERTPLSPRPTQPYRPQSGHAPISDDLQACPTPTQRSLQPNSQATLEPRVNAVPSRRTRRSNRAQEQLVQERPFCDLEAIVMDRIWLHDDKVTVRQIFDELSGARQIAYTTVMSPMDNLHRKDWLARERSGKAYLYWPSMTREERSARLMRSALNSGGDSDLVLTYFLEQISEEDSARLKDALRRAFRGRRAR